MPRSRFLLGASAIALFTMLACNQQTGSDSDSDGAAKTASMSSAIQGGVIDTKSTFSIALRGRGLCTSTLIAPNLLLTARHCVEVQPSKSADGCEDSQLLGADELYATTSSTPLEQHGPGGWITVDKVLVGPKKNNCDPDIAMVQLSDNIPASQATPVTPNVNADAKAHFTTKVTAIGFGLDDQGEPGTRRKRENIPVLCVVGDTNFKCGQYASWIQPFEIVAGKGACEGDSGGGLYDQTSMTTGPVVVATVSRGGVDQQTGACQEGAYVRVDQFADWIKQAGIAAAKAGSYPAPAWTGTAPAPQSETPAVETPTEEAPPAEEADAPTTEAPKSTTTTTTTSGCTFAAASSPSSSGFMVAMVLGVGLIVTRRRSRRV